MTALLPDLRVPSYTRTHQRGLKPKAERDRGHAHKDWGAAWNLGVANFKYKLVGASTYKPALRSLKQKDCHEFEFSLGYK